jgi:hypothetical protein
MGLQFYPTKKLTDCHSKRGEASKGAMEVIE